MRDITRALEPQGLSSIIVPSAGDEHRFPVDWCRLYSEGSRVATRYASLEKLEIWTRWEDRSQDKDESNEWHDSILVARRPKEKWSRRWGRASRAGATTASSDDSSLARFDFALPALPRPSSPARSGARLQRLRRFLCSARDGAGFSRGRTSAASEQSVRHGIRGYPRTRRWLDVARGRDRHAPCQLRHVRAQDFSAHRRGWRGAPTPVSQRRIRSRFCLQCFRIFAGTGNGGGRNPAGTETGGSLALHTAFLQAPHHYHATTDFGVREWFAGVEIERCEVSGNLSPGLMPRFFSASLLETLRQNEMPVAEQKAIAQSRVGQWADFWNRRATPPTGFATVEALPQELQKRVAADFELRARKPGLAE